MPIKKLTTPDEVEAAVRYYFDIRGPIEIHDDLTVSVLDQETVYQFRLAKTIPFKFRTLYSFHSENHDLQDLGCLPDTPFEAVAVTYYPTMALLRTLNAKFIRLMRRTWDFGDTVERAQDIVTRYQGQGQSAVVACAAELAAAGLKENARW